ncbi:hypothetical protein Pse7367_3120 [Thalassoporum mexicanum PCC 7367]|uniref:tetratricopeptide repeat protein n=1 Tax=Thalassoporum mexicanum TaxID=3457544 RepID=UPI00029FDB49|nr:tetratricopeptide repeat protein [Pseudanabaena sp. PCC 7367]AFY71368.1 hypothetical protein Pse7367_3120 [Pseudanabaena sp. PCC 7367]
MVSSNETNNQESALVAQTLQEGWLLKQQDLNRAIAVLEEGLRAAMASEDLLLGVIADLELALALIESGINEQLQEAKSLLIVAGKKLKDCSTCYQQKAYLLYCQGRWNLQQAKFEDGVKFLNLAQKSPQLKPGLDVLVNCALANYRANKGEFEQALPLLEQLLDRLPEEDDLDRALILKQLGLLYLLLDDHEHAAAYLEQCLDLALHIEHKYLRIEAMAGLSHVAIAQAEYETAGMLIQERLQIIDKPGDLSWAAYAYVDLAEAMLGAGEINDAHECIKAEVIPRFDQLQDQRGIAKTKRVLGLIWLHKIMDGLVSLNEETIEIAEDYLLEASMLFEQHQMLKHYAVTLADMARLYNISANTQYQFQFQGKSLRSLEMAMATLDQFEIRPPILDAQIEELFSVI